MLPVATINICVYLQNEEVMGNVNGVLIISNQ